MIEQILACCARQDPIAATIPVLEECFDGFSQWDLLLDRAQFHGMAPLLWHHLKMSTISVPIQQKHLLKLLAYRCRHANQVRLSLLKEVLKLLQQAGIEVVVLKGMVLASQIYSEIGMRPMRDIDLLLKEESFEDAENVLSGLGFRAEIPHHVLQEHHHMVPLFKEIDGVHVELELHRRLLPVLPRYPKLDYDAVAQNLITIDLEGVEAFSLDYGGMLCYLFEHGFRMPLYYEPFRLMHLADIVTLVEKKFDVIDWQEMGRVSPEVLSGLAQLHQLCPFSEPVMEHLGIKESRAAVTIGKDYQGWPRHRWSTTEKSRYPQLLLDTLFPPLWWQHLYYNDGKKYSTLAYWFLHLSYIAELMAEWRLRHYPERNEKPPVTIRWLQWLSDSLRFAAKGFPSLR
ncbi:MAG: nucleotidyltransferase family protein [Thermodesulfobacteriota bacterium]